MYIIGGLCGSKDVYISLHRCRKALSIIHYPPLHRAPQLVNLRGGMTTLESPLNVDS
jgi:hypothetical protein